jgi:hypothetical protein
LASGWVRIHGGVHAKDVCAPTLVDLIVENMSKMQGTITPNYPK